jgi:outer membrane lipoprotein-sorting protein
MISKKQVAYIAVVGIVACLAIYFFVSGQQDEPSDIIPNPSGVATGANALYDKMIETMQKAESLSYKSNYRFVAGEEIYADYVYTVWMKKPNHFRIEAIHNNDGTNAGTLIGDGEYLWICWSGERPSFSLKDRLGKSGKENRSNVYMKEPMPTSKESIRSKATDKFSAGPYIPVIDPSTFHGYGYTLAKKPQIHDIKNKGTDKVRDIECDVIEVSFKISRQTWQFWLAKSDHLPRKLKRVTIKDEGDGVIEEQWSDVIVNAEIAADKFTWSPPEGWKQFYRPDSEK